MLNQTQTPILGLLELVELLKVVAFAVRLDGKLGKPEEKVQSFFRFDIVVLGWSIWVVTGCKVINGSNGLFVAWPERLVGGKYESITFSPQAAVRHHIQEKALALYEKAKAASQSTTATTTINKEA